MAASTRTRTAPLIPTGTWRIDAAHSSVRFSVKHMGIANVRGKFSEFEGTLEMKESLADCRAFGTVKVASIDTGEPQRDDHLRSADFFNVEEFPEVRFDSTHVEAIDDESSRVVGNLTMHGVTREITLDVLIQGTDTDPWGNTRAASRSSIRITNAPPERRHDSHASRAVRALPRCRRPVGLGA